MKLRLQDIPEGVLNLREERPESWLRDAMHLEAADQYRPSSPVEIELKLRKHRRRVSVSGRARLKLAFSCSRCGREGVMDLAVPVRETFLPADRFRRPEKKKVDLEEEDFQNAFYENDDIDLKRYIAESILLALPMYPLCEDGDACAPGPVAYSEDWGVSEKGKDVNPAWKEGMARVKRRFGDQ